MTIKSVFLAGAALLAAPTIAAAQDGAPPSRTAQPAGQPAASTEGDLSEHTPETGPSVLGEVVVTGQAPDLAPEYATLGRVSKGLPVVERIGRLGDPTSGGTGTPMEPVVISKTKVSAY